MQTILCFSFLFPIQIQHLLKLNGFDSVQFVSGVEVIQIQHLLKLNSALYICPADFSIFKYNIC